MQPKPAAEFQPVILSRRGMARGATASIEHRLAILDIRDTCRIASARTKERPVKGRVCDNEEPGKTEDRQGRDPHQKLAHASLHRHLCLGANGSSKHHAANARCAPETPDAHQIFHAAASAAILLRAEIGVAGATVAEDLASSSLEAGLIVDGCQSGSRVGVELGEEAVELGLVVPDRRRGLGVTGA